MNGGVRVGTYQLPEPTTVTLCFFSRGASVAILARSAERVDEVARDEEAEAEAEAEAAPPRLEMTAVRRRDAVAAAGEAFESMNYEWREGGKE